MNTNGSSGALQPHHPRCALNLPQAMPHSCARIYVSALPCCRISFVTDLVNNARRKQRELRVCGLFGQSHQQAKLESLRKVR